MTREQVISLIIEYILGVMKDNPIKEQGKTYENSIYYLNGNDGTDFDWEVNGRTCEFAICYDTKKAWCYIQVWATTKGTLEGYVWDTERWQNGKKLPSKEIGVEISNKIKDFCMNIDYSRKWDKKIADLVGAKNETD